MINKIRKLKYKATLFYCKYVKRSKIRIKSEGPVGWVFIDGKQISGVRSYTVTHSVNGFATVTLELVGREVEFCGDRVAPVAIKEAIDENKP